MKTNWIWLWVMMCWFPALGQEAELRQILTEANLQGSITLYDYQADRWIYSDSVDACQQSLPASTFKILNTLIALDRKVVADEHEVWEWDGVERAFPVWNADTDLYHAFRNSTVWFYQRLAEKVGRRPYEHYFRAWKFGNQVIGPNVDRFWLDGSLQISPRQQIDFLRRVYEEKRPFSKAAYASLKPMMIEQEVDGWVIRGKTGWGLAESKDIGWWVGWVEHGEEVYFFATRIWKYQEIERPAFARDRKKMTFAALKKMGWWPVKSP